MRLLTSTVAQSGLPLILALSLWACTRDAGPGITVSCEGGVSSKGYITVKNPLSRLKETSDSPWIIELKGKVADDIKSAEEACAVIFDLARQLELRAEVKDKTTVIIYGRDLEVNVPAGVRLKIEKFDKL